MNIIKKIALLAVSIMLLGIAFIGIGSLLGGINYLKNTNIDDFSVEKASALNIDYVNSKIKTQDLEAFTNINLDITQTELEIKESENDKYYLEYKDYLDDYIKVYIENDTLKIQETNEFNFGFDTRKNKKNFDLNILKQVILNMNINEYDIDNSLVLYVPKVDFDKIYIRNEKGSIKVNDLSAKEMELDADLGNIELYNVNAHNTLNVKVDMGNISLNSCKARIYDISENMGNVEFDKLEVLDRLKIKNDLGQIEGSVIYDSKKDYDVKASNNLGNTSVDSKFNERNVYSSTIVYIELENNMGNINLIAK